MQVEPTSHVEPTSLKFSPNVSSETFEVEVERHADTGRFGFRLSEITYQAEDNAETTLRLFVTDFTAPASGSAGATANKQPGGAPASSSKAVASLLALGDEILGLGVQRRDPPSSSNPRGPRHTAAAPRSSSSSSKSKRVSSQATRSSSSSSVISLVTPLGLTDAENFLQNVGAGERAVLRVQRLVNPGGVQILFTEPQSQPLDTASGSVLSRGNASQESSAAAPERQLASSLTSIVEALSKLPATALEATTSELSPPSVASLASSRRPLSAAVASAAASPASPAVSALSAASSSFFEEDSANKSKGRGSSAAPASISAAPGSQKKKRSRKSADAAVASAADLTVANATKKEMAGGGGADVKRQPPPHSEKRRRRSTFKAEKGDDDTDTNNGCTGNSSGTSRSRSSSSNSSSSSSSSSGNIVNNSGNNSGNDNTISNGTIVWFRYTKRDWEWPAIVFESWQQVKDWGLPMPHKMVGAGHQTAAVGVGSVAGSGAGGGGGGGSDSGSKKQTLGLPPLPSGVACIVLFCGRTCEYGLVKDKGRLRVMQMKTKNKKSKKNKKNDEKGEEGGNDNVDDEELLDVPRNAGMTPKAREELEFAIDEAKELLLENRGDGDGQDDGDDDDYEEDNDDEAGADGGSVGDGSEGGDDNDGGGLESKRTRSSSSNGGSPLVKAASSSSSSDIAARAFKAQKVGNDRGAKADASSLERGEADAPNKRATSVTTAAAALPSSASPSSSPLSASSSSSSYSASSSSSSSSSSSLPSSSVRSFKGVRILRGRHRKFNARIQVCGKLVHIGYYTSQRRAALCYDEVARAHGLPTRSGFVCSGDHPENFSSEEEEEEEGEGEGEEGEKEDEGSASRVSSNHINPHAVEKLGEILAEFKNKNTIPPTMERGASTAGNSNSSSSSSRSSSSIQHRKDDDDDDDDDVDYGEEQEETCSKRLDAEASPRSSRRLSSKRRARDDNTYEAFQKRVLIATRATKCPICLECFVDDVEKMDSMLESSMAQNNAAARAALNHANHASSSSSSAAAASATTTTTPPTSPCVPTSPSASPAALPPPPEAAAAAIATASSPAPSSSSSSTSASPSSHGGLSRRESRAAALPPVLSAAAAALTSACASGSALRMSVKASTNTGDCKDEDGGEGGKVQVTRMRCCKTWYHVDCLFAHEQSSLQHCQQSSPGSSNSGSSSGSSSGGGGQQSGGGVMKLRCPICRDTTTYQRQVRQVRRDMAQEEDALKRQQREQAKREANQKKRLALEETFDNVAAEE